MMKVLTAIAVLAALLVSGAAPAFGFGSIQPEKAVDVDALYQKALNLEQGRGDLDGALKAYERVVSAYESARPLAAKAQLHIAGILARQGHNDEAIAAYRDTAEKFPGSPEAAEAVDHLKAVGVGVKASASADDEIQAKLQKRIPEVEFSSNTVGEFADYVRSVGDVNVVVDPQVKSALEPPGVPQAVMPKQGPRGTAVVGPVIAPATGPREATIDLSLRSVTVFDLLNLGTKQLGLGWAIYSGAVYISLPSTIASIGHAAGGEPRVPGSGTIQDPRVTALINQWYEGKIDERGMRDTVKKLVEEGKLKPDAQMEFAEFLRTVGMTMSQIRRKITSEGQTIAPRDVLQRALRETGYGPLVAAEAPGEVPAKPEDKSKTVMLYRAGLPNFAGPMFLDLDTGKTTALPRGMDTKGFLLANPDYDLAYVPSYGLVANAGTTVAPVSNYAKPDTLPDLIEYPQPRDFAVLAEYIKRNGGEMPEPGVYVDSEGIGYLWNLNPFALRTATGEAFYCRSNSGSDATQVSYWPVGKKEFVPMAPQPAAPEGANAPEPTPFRSVTLYGLQLRNFAGPQLLSFKTGETRTAPPNYLFEDDTVSNVFNDAPGFDVAFAYGMPVLFAKGNLPSQTFSDRMIILRKGIEAVLVPKGIAAEKLPRPISFPSPESLPQLWQTWRNGKFDYHAGVYSSASGATIVVPGQNWVIVKAFDTEYELVPGNIQSPEAESLTVNYKQINTASKAGGALESTASAAEAPSADAVGAEE